MARSRTLQRRNARNGNRSNRAPKNRPACGSRDILPIRTPKANQAQTYAEPDVAEQSVERSEQYRLAWKICIYGRFLRDSRAPMLRVHIMAMQKPAGDGLEHLPMFIRGTGLR